MFSCIPLVEDLILTISFNRKKPSGHNEKVDLRKETAFVSMKIFSWPFISALRALFSSPFFLSCFEALFLSTKSSNPRHGLSSCAWPRRSFPLPVTFKRKDIAVRKTSRIFALISTQRLASIGMSGSMPFEHCKSPLIVFESAKVSEVFDVRGKQERRREAGPVRLSKKRYLQKTNASPSRTWQHPTTQCLQNPSFAIDKPTAALALRKIPRSSMPSWLLFSPVLSHSYSATSCETTRACNALQRATLSTVESGKNVTFFEQLFCFYQLVLVVWNTFGAKFKLPFISWVKQNWHFLRQCRKKLPFPHLGGLLGETGSGKNHFSGHGFSRGLARLASFYSITEPLVQFFRCSPCLPWQRWRIHVRWPPYPRLQAGRLSTFFIAVRTFDFLDKHINVQQNLMINS